MFTSLWNTRYDWQFYIEKSNNYARAFKDGPAWPRGKMVGGTMGLNAMVHIRGFPYDYDRWEELGNPNWNYQQAKPILERIENNMAVNRTTTDHRGPLKIDYTYSQDQVRYVLSDAAEEHGYPWVPEFNDQYKIGYTNTQAHIYRGVRQSTARAYLVPAAKRSNLHVIKSSHVTKVVMKGDKATGVDFIRGNHLYTARARKEVILSAGTVSTPPILMHSGIGPKVHLKKMGIPVINDLPVGRNLEDHVLSAQFLALSNYPYNQAATADQSLDMIYTYLKSFSGPLSTTGFDFIGFVNTKTGAEADKPNMEHLHAVMEPASANLEGFLRQQRYQDHHIAQLVELNKNATIVVIISCLTNPKSKGKIELRNRDPRAAPRIYPNYLDEQSDVEILGEAMKWQYSLENTNAFKAAGGKFHFFNDLQCPNFPSQEYFECYARHISGTPFHPVGTARMGSPSDGVVDTKLRVYGTRQLRVCDASVIPVIPSVNINAAVMVVGERCADFIKEKYKFG